MENSLIVVVGSRSYQNFCSVVHDVVFTFNVVGYFFNVVLMSLNTIFIVVLCLIFSQFYEF
ncbi:hypothetical protein Lalb_Chr05g0228461 [Lupinus albus]|uniref:Uncharacterized protein n=1 Tax=Lupinus albus TaxID=3870 RepID=A0A6A4QJ44_LUPAL|nr:hypothetical protein Lalb_Chr05g0228461 [Lupinus albus]